jgi:hypothetical protein
MARPRKDGRAPTRAAPHRQGAHHGVRAGLASPGLRPHRWRALRAGRVHQPRHR